jgi:hypothetical protein
MFAELECFENDVGVSGFGEWSLHLFSNRLRISYFFFETNLYIFPIQPSHFRTWAVTLCH